MLPTIIIASAIGAGVVAIIANEIRKKLTGKSSCSCGKSCAACGLCSRGESEEDKK